MADRKSIAVLVGLAAFAAAVGSTSCAAEAESPAGAGPVDFQRDIGPIFSDTCYTCHGPDRAKRSTELRLDSRAGAFVDLGGYQAIVPGKPDKSPLYQRITSDDKDERMPPPTSHRHLTPAQIELIRRWIQAGAVWRDHWSLIAPKRPPLPAVKRAGWVRNGIDPFVLARLEQAGLGPSPEAGRETLIRRVTLDLTGLPPTLAEVDAFLADRGPNAYEKVVDRLLASPHYGEHMAAEWLDAARYSDTNGYQEDGTRTMWPWRDWVIGALNENMPFDQFTIEQLAGDLLPNATPRQRLATGFNRNHPLNGEGGRIPEESRVEYVVDRVDTTSTIWLGLTVGCGRCHDHKYDPIKQREFYQMFAFFNNIAETGGVDRGGNARPVMTWKVPNPRLDRIQARIARLEKGLTQESSAESAAEAKWEVGFQTAVRTSSTLPAGPPADVRDMLIRPAAKRTPGERRAVLNYYRAVAPEFKTLRDELAALKKQEAVEKRASILDAMVMQERLTPRETFVLYRGQFDKPDKQQQVLPGVPACLPPLAKDAPPNRLGLARWLVDPANPLTARVTVNHYWQHFFGTGLVKTLEDFGSQGEPPSHPELLDYLATEFRDGHWNVKAIDRLIVTSATYRQSSGETPELLDRDPYNRLLSRGPRFRLSSFAIRDQALAVSGLLVDRLGGPPVKPYQPPGVWADFSLGKIKYVQDHGENLYRRSLYIFWRRSVSPTMLFDAASRQVCTVHQSRTNSPLHALTLLNDTTYVEAARALAERVMKEGGAAPAARIARAFRLATAREPLPAEREVLVAELDRARDHFRSHPQAAKDLLAIGESPRDPKLDSAELAAYTSVMNVLLNLDEVLTKE